MKTKQKCAPRKADADATYDAIDNGLLVDARAGINQGIFVAAAILRLPDGKERIAYAMLEYGDGEGQRQIEEYVDEVKSGSAELMPGEEIRAVLFSVDGLSETLVDFREEAPSLQ